HDTPAAVSRSPNAASPGHWCDSPQPDAMTDVCAEALLFRPALIVNGASPCAARALLITASTWLAGSDAEDVLLVDDVAGALEAAELCDEVEPAADCEGGFMVLFEVLVVGL